MKVITGKVVGGKVELPAGALAEGESVAVVTHDTSDPFVLTDAEQQDLTDAFEASARGEFVDGDQLLQRLGERHASCGDS